ncbi:MAG TPA: hypothetical protein VGC30_02755 [Dokdonella sp.]
MRARAGAASVALACRRPRSSTAVATPSRARLRLAFAANRRLRNGAAARSPSARPTKGLNERSASTIDRSRAAVRAHSDASRMPAQLAFVTRRAGGALRARHVRRGAYGIIARLFCAVSARPC